MRNYKYYKRYCSDIDNVENFEKASADNFVGWCCHHRLQTWTSDGERREVNISAAELKALGMYYNRPASELIFLTESEHSKLHNAFNKGKYAGENNAMYGKHHTEETRKKLSEASKGNKYFLGKHHTDEARRKMSEAKKGTRWYNDGKINIRAKECPDGFTPGRLLI